MSNNKSFADFIRDWEKLLAAYEANAETLAGNESLKLQLEAIVDQARDLKNQQEIQIGVKQATTKKCREIARAGNEVARSLRSIARGRIGPRDERLVAFSVAPLRDRRARRGEAEPAEGAPPAPEAAPPSPPGTSPPAGKPAKSSET
jgi:hypothetical protein